MWICETASDTKRLQRLDKHPQGGYCPKSLFPFSTELQSNNFYPEEFHLRDRYLDGTAAKISSAIKKEITHT